jgi:tetratricopeptide (TPR) repeat protein
LISVCSYRIRFVVLRFVVPVWISLLALTIAPIAGSAQGKAQAESHPATAILQGNVRSPGGKPLAGVTVSLEFANGTATETWRAHTNASGIYRFDGVRAGSYRLRIQGTENIVALIKSVELAAGESKKIDLVVEAAPTTSQASQDSSSSPEKSPELFDEPTFTVAGVTQAANAGGHGSDTVLRNSEVLVRDTASLSEGFDKKDNAGSVVTPVVVVAATPNSAEASKLIDEGAEIQAKLLRQQNEESGKALDGTADSSTAPLPKQAKLYHRLAQIDEKLGNPVQAAHEYERAAELDPNEAHLFDWATELLRHRALEPATAVFTKGTMLHPKSARMLIGLGVAWYARGSYEQATEFLVRASDIDQKDPGPYLFMGKMLSVQTTVPALTMEKLERFVRLAPENAMANYYYALGLWKTKEGSLDEASAKQIEDLLQTATRLDPKLGAAELQLGILYAQQGDNARAVAAYQKAIEMSPELEEAHYRLALAYKKTGDAAGAGKELKLHEQLAKLASERAEQERGEVQEFVITLRDK